MKKTKNKVSPVKLIIDRSKWATGNCTQLYDTDTKKMDCLGFIARQLFRAKVKDISGFYTPADCANVKWAIPFKPIDISDKSTMMYDNVQFVRDLMTYNDSKVITQKAREINIFSHLESIGIKTKFVGKK